EEIVQTSSVWARALLGRPPPLCADTDEQRATIGVRPAGAFLFTPDRTELQLWGACDFPPEQIGMRIPADLGLPGLVARTGEPLVVTNTEEDPRFLQIIATGRAGSTVQAPVKVNGDCLGLVFAASMAKNVYWPEDLEALLVFADLTAAAIRASGDLSRFDPPRP
ncbi:MAG: GAF domain-containing protein, partial [Chloroflexi bacterium]|nr:GAF domain-containing protein [Chloroflexota bacterium]